MRRPKRLGAALRLLAIAGGVVLLGTSAVLLTRFYVPDDWGLLGPVQRTLGINRQSYGRELAKSVAAHRGYGGRDNSARSIRNALKGGARIVEIDVRWCGDEWILFHDATTECLAGGSEDQRVALLTRDDLLEMQGEVDPDEVILSLDEALAGFGSEGMTWLVDIKDSDRCSELVATLGKNGISPENDNAILLGVYEILRQYTGSGFPLAYCAGFTEGNNNKAFVLGHDFILDRCEMLDSNSNLKHLVLPSPFLRQSLIQEAKREGLKVWSYAVIHPKDAGREYRNWLALGVDGLIVDDLPVGMSLRAKDATPGARE